MANDGLSLFFRSLFRQFGVGHVARLRQASQVSAPLRATALAQPGLTARLGALPLFAVAQVGAIRVGIVHGDADSLAGWGFSQEALATPEGLDAAGEAIATAGVGVIASSHTCLPVLQRFANGACDSVLINNGAAGMPNFRGGLYGVITRIATTPCAAQPALYGTRIEGVFVDALAVN